MELKGAGADRTVAILTKYFRCPGDLVSVARLEQGHINSTWVATYSQAGRPVRYLVQQINGEVFNTTILVRNMELLLDHLGSRLSHLPDASRRTLTLLATRTRYPERLYCDSVGLYWRVMLYIEESISVEQIDTPRQAHTAAYAFGHFVSLLRDLQPRQLGETIPYFHDVGRRYQALEAAWAQADDSRRTRAATLYAAATRHAAIVAQMNRLIAEGMPLRVVHNDAKIGNLLLDAHTGEGLCVIDWDTVMPGYVLYDFGDLVRSCASPVPEDSTDLEAIVVRREVLQALVDGYLAGAGNLLLPVERANLLFGGLLMTYLMALRFLTDDLQGNVYYHTAYPDHNFDRARNQFRLLDLLAEHPLMVRWR
ncbi:MAG: phosphotransferase [Bacteroidia bacterium]